MSQKEKMPRIERQLRLYEIVCQFAIIQFEAVCEIFPYNMPLLQRDLADLGDAGLVSVKYSRKGNGYVKTGKPELAHKVKPCKMAHLKRLNRLGTLMSELVNEDIPLWEKRTTRKAAMSRSMLLLRILTMNCFPVCRNGQGRETLRCCAGLVTKFFMIRRNIVFVMTITVSL